MSSALSIAALVGAAVATLLGALLSCVDGGLTPRVTIVSLALSLVAVATCFRGCRRKDLTEPPPGRWDRAAMGLFAVVALRHFLFIAFEHSGGVSTADPYNYGDLPLHWTYIRYFANGAPFWPENPIFTGARLQYPFGVDLLTAFFVQLGVPMGVALTALGLAGSALLLVALDRWGRGFAIAAFLFSGGLPGAFSRALPGDERAWKNLFLALFVPQRGFLFALPAGLLLLWSWRRRLLRDLQGLPVWVEGVLWGVMPLFHLHTFLFLSIVVAVWALVSRKIREASQAFAWALVPASWSTFQVTDGFRAASLVWWKPGWVIGATSPAVFLVANFTLFLPLFLVAAYRALRAGDREGRATILTGLALFAMLFFVMLAPWEWDNTKIMIWCYLLMLPAAARLAIEPLPAATRAVALVALLSPGALAIGASLDPSHAYPVVDVAEERSVCAGLAALPVTARLATVQTFNHPVALCGHPLIAGYSGHLWSHGIRSGAVEEALRSVMMGRPGWEGTASALEARYLFWGPREAAEFAGSTRPWEGSRRRVWEGPWGRVYDLGS
jgi:hypothetical protein